MLLLRYSAGLWSGIPASHCRCVEWCSDVGCVGCHWSLVSRFAKQLGIRGIRKSCDYGDSHQECVSSLLPTPGIFADWCFTIVGRRQWKSIQETQELHRLAQVNNQQRYPMTQSVVQFGTCIFNYVSSLSRSRPCQCRSCDLQAGRHAQPGCIRTVTYKIGQTITVQGAVDSGSMCPMDSWGPKGVADLLQKEAA